MVVVLIGSLIDSPLAGPPAAAFLSVLKAHSIKTRRALAVCEAAW
jgi:hypothetical protein